LEQILDPRADSATIGRGPHIGKSGASWAAIFAGAIVAVAASLILVALGSGIGFASISPWQNHGISVTTFAMTTAIWLIVTQWVSAALGGYLAGRLRSRWIGTHTHEVFFRDTAQGLVTWALATVIVFAIAAGSAAAGAGAGTRAAAEAAAPVSAYTIDKLFRPAVAGSGATNNQASDPRLDTAHIVANAMSSGGVADSDRAYLVEQVAARTGASQAEAKDRVDNFVSNVMDAQAKVKADADAARKAAAQASIYLALSLLVGAFIASVSAALGGRLRDEHI
jgi:hypothetical protein